MVQLRVGALLGASDPFLFSRRDRLASLTARHGMPAIYYLAEFARAGGLMANGNSLTDMYRLIGVYVGRILKGEKTADLPVVQSTTATPDLAGLSSIFSIFPTVVPAAREARGRGSGR
jgi:putative tryptophan/tyrosine transport system substrate-binding protein